MKNRLLKITKILLLILTCCAMFTTNAETAASKLTITSYSKSSTPVKYPATFHVKKTSKGKYVYCMYYSKKTPSKGISYSKGSLIKDNGVNYILNQAYAAKNDSDFFTYQTALWIYMVDKGIMKGTHHEISRFKSTVNNSSSGTAKKIKSLISAAKKASSNNTSAPTIKVDASNVTFKLDSSKQYYVSSNITVTSSTDKYTVNLTNAPAGSTTAINGKYFTIKVPASKVTNSKTTINFTVNNSKTVYTSYYYNPSNKKYQIMADTVKDTKTANASASVSIEKKSSILVAKVDATTGKIVSGASLQIINSNGTVIDSWTSTKEAHTISGLTQGTYTLKEIAAPKGYILSNVQTKFTVGADGKIKDSNGKEITKIEFKNEETSITISKQDITTKEELKGANLVIKDANGNEIIKWTSSDKKYVIKGLSEGTYTLTETIAPEGYALSTETITFKIDKYGKLYNGNGTSVDSIVMYNSPIKKQDVAISKRDITTNEELEGATLKLTDASGNTIDTWTSTKEEHIIKDLKEGTYSLTETIAPEGYALSTETITFKIDAEGKLYDQDGNSISKVIMYNTKKETPGGVSVSKQDITNGKELPGATLVIKDYDGNVIDTWVSTEQPHIIEELKAGIYTLTETIAPAGYILSSETITFNVKDDGSITKVVMYNSPNSKDVPVENTASYKTITSYVIGTIIILAGTIMITKNIKKKEN